MTEQLVDKIKSEHISINKNIFGGSPCLAGTRMPVGQLIAELVERSPNAINEIAENFNLNKENLIEMYNEVAVFFIQKMG